MIVITCDRCGIDMTEYFANDLYDLNKNGNKDRFDGIGWMLAMALVFNYRLNRHFLYCKKCTGINSLRELGQETLIDFDKLRLYKQWKDSDKRGLELSNEIKKRRVRVLIGDHSWENIGPVISDYIQKQFSKNYDLTFNWSWYCEEILELAEKRAIEIYILFLTNLNIRHHTYGSDRIKNTLKLISKIRKEYGRPVIGLFSPSVDSFAAEAKFVSDFSFVAPCKLHELKRAFEKCLEMLKLDKNETSQ